MQPRTCLIAMGALSASLTAASAHAGYWKLQQASYSESTQKVLERGEWQGGAFKVTDHGTGHFGIQANYDVGVSRQRAYWRMPATLTPDRPIGAAVSVDCISWKPYPGRESFPGPSLIPASLGGVGRPVVAGGGDQGICESPRFQRSGRIWIR